MDKYQQMIPDYLNGLLQGAELQAFERQLKTDIALQNMLQTEQQIHNVIKDTDRSQLPQADFAQFAQRLEAPVHTFKFGWGMPVAAALVLGVGLTVLNLTPDGTQTDWPSGEASGYTTLTDTLPAYDHDIVRIVARSPQAYERLLEDFAGSLLNQYPQARVLDINADNATTLATQLSKRDDIAWVRVVPGDVLPARSSTDH